MIRRLVYRAMAVGTLALVLQTLGFGLASAQDFSSLVQQAATANQTWVNEIQTASQATTLATLQADAATALATGKQVQSLLQQALPLASNDAQRSRIQGLLGHTTNAINAGQRIASDTSLSVARSDLNAERGEAQETLNELGPFAKTLPSATATPTTPTLPATGGTPIGLVLGLGFMLTTAGLVLRRGMGNGCPD